MLKHLARPGCSCMPILIENFHSLPASHVTELDAADAAKTRELKSSGLYKDFASSRATRAKGPLCHFAIHMFGADASRINRTRTVSIA